MPAAAGTPGYESEAWSLEAFGCHWCRPSTSPEFRPRIGVPGRLFAGITMALRRPHKRMKIAGCRVGFFHRLLGVPLPTPLDSRPSPE